MRLLVISHTPHYLRSGVLVGWGPTVRELSHLAAIFDSVVHVAPLHSGSAPGSSLAYENEKVRFVPVPPSGGSGILAKAGVLASLPAYLRAISSEIRTADVVHVRCPAHIGMLAALFLSTVRTPRTRWIKYAGDWRPGGPEPWSYSFQRWWLKRGLSRALVTVNGEWEDSPAHIYPFLNPCLTEDELEEGRAAACDKRLEGPPRLLFVGRAERAKGVARALKIVAGLRAAGTEASLDIVGDGPERPELEELSGCLGLDGSVKFHGWLPRHALGEFYRRAHIMLFPSSSSEGWPKVLSEAMAFGVVPVAGNVSSIPSYLRAFACGRACAPDDLESFAAAIEFYRRAPGDWRAEAENAVRAAALFTYRNYLRAVAALLSAGGSGPQDRDLWGVHRLSPSSGGLI